MNKDLNHFDARGNAHMVDVGNKGLTVRTAAASGRIYVNSHIFEAIQAGSAAKGDVLGVSRVAGIMAVKRTADLIPLAHPVKITKCCIDFSQHAEKVTVAGQPAGFIEAVCTVSAADVTGVEMEALCGVSAALLTIYDMTKSLGKDMVISDIRLLSKTGGKSGDYVAGENP